MIGIVAMLVVSGCAAERGDRDHADAAHGHRNHGATDAPSVATPPPAAWDTAALQGAYDALAPTLSGTVGVGVAAVGGDVVTALGAWDSGVAWSTIKVPLAISALQRDPVNAASLASVAITVSDNAAAEQLWAMLGAGPGAATEVEAVLREGGDATTVVQSQRVRPEFTAFGQTDWSLAQQTLFTAHLPCLPEATAVVGLMSQISPDQQWGLARIDASASKAGWGPGADGSYLVRQLAVVPTGDGQTAVTLAAEPADGSFASGVAMLDQLEAWVQSNESLLPSGRCAA